MNFIEIGSVDVVSGRNGPLMKRPFRELTAASEALMAEQTM
jgi:hypothetical protein